MMHAYINNTTHGLIRLVTHVYKPSGVGTCSCTCTYVCSAHTCVAIARKLEVINLLEKGRQLFPVAYAGILKGPGHYVEGRILIDGAP